MDIQENHRTENIQRICLYLAPLLSVAVHYFLERETLQTLVSDGIFMVLLSSGFLVFMRTSGRKIFQGITHDVLFWGCFTLSLLLLGLHSVRSVGVLWLLVVAFAAMEMGMELAVSIHIFLMTAYVIVVLLAGGDLYAFAAALLFGFILATLFSLYRSREATLYLAIILLAVDGVLQLVLYRLNMSALLAHSGQIVAEMAGILVLVFLGYCFLRYLPAVGETEVPGGMSVPERQMDGEEVLAQEAGEVASAPEQSIGGEDLTPEQLSREEQLAQLLEKEFPLAGNLREYSKDLYQHSRCIADLSERGTNAIGGDALLARVGGFYHEIGRITGEENYIEAGIALGEKYAFPGDVQAVIRQHSPGYEIPKSPEAAVVMLSDCILSTSEYLTKKGMRDKMPDEKLVHSIFQNRLSKGNLKESGMSVEQLEDLQSYFVAHAFEKGV